RDRPNGPGNRAEGDPATGRDAKRRADRASRVSGSTGIGPRTTYHDPIAASYSISPPRSITPSAPPPPSQPPPHTPTPCHPAHTREHVRPRRRWRLPPGRGRPGRAVPGLLAPPPPLPPPARPRPRRGAGPAPGLRRPLAGEERLGGRRSGAGPVPLVPPCGLS